jgi:hypothetical protein
VHIGVQRVPMALSCGAADLMPNLATARKRMAPAAQSRG